jgi:uncharacterized protein YbjT (DUF2867 family)
MQQLVALRQGAINVMNASLPSLRSPILVAGGSGNLGRQIIHRLIERGLPVRVLTRDPIHAAYLQNPLVEIIQGDVRDQQAVEQVVAGTQTIISAVHGFAGTNGSNPYSVDYLGNKNLIHAASRHNCKHFILISTQGAALDHPIELFRMKAQAEQELRASQLQWTIIRATAFMETWATLIGEPLIKTGKTLIFGRGHNPINFVSVYDVAHFVEQAVVDPAMQSLALEVGGPENLSMRQVVQTFESVVGKSGKVNAVPLPVMRLLAVLMRPINPTLARQIQAGVVMDTRDMSFNASELCRHYPSVPLTTLADVIKREYCPSD